MKKAIRSIMSIVLAIIMVLSALPMGVLPALAAGADLKTGDIITFGSYPQAKVTDSSLIASLNSCTLSADNTVTYDGAKYKRVYFTQYSPNNTTSTDYSGYIQKSNGYFINTVYWFKYEPVQWRVLSNTNGELFVMAEKILNSLPYDQEYASKTWETSTIRYWLNNDFYNAAFSNEERLKIINSSLINEDNPTYNTEGGNNTVDKLFLLSISEEANTAYGFNAKFDTSDAARAAQGTEFSKCNGLQVQSGGISTGYSMWWLRSPGYDSKGPECVCENGYAGYSYQINITNFGIRPAFRINLPASGFRIITFNAGGGKGGFSAVTTSGEALSVPIVTRTGYTFTGWSPSVPPMVPSTDRTYTAQWRINKYTISFHANGGVGSAESITQDYNTSVALPSAGFTKAGYTLLGWNTSAKASTALSSYTVPACNKTLYAIWVPNSYTVTFNTNGGSDVAPITQSYNTTVYNPIDPTKEGYVFAGWYADAELKTAVTWPYTILDNNTFYAKWNPATTYTVTFDAQGGFVSPATKVYIIRNGIYERLPAASRIGYNFMGWYTSPIIDGERVYNSLEIYSSCTLYARWNPKSLKVSLDAQGGSVTTSPITVTYGNTYGSLPVPTKDGCTFDSWWTSPGGRGTQIINTTTALIDDAQTLYAKWIALNGCTITFDDGDGSGGTSYSLIPGETFTAPSVSKTGYTFAGWLPSLPPTVPSEDTIYVAQWTINSYTVTFNNFGGTGSAAPVTQEYNTSVNLPTTGFEKKDCTFLGWNTELDATSALSSFIMPAHNTYLFAIYRLNCYSMNLNCNDGTGLTFDSYSLPVGTRVSFDRYSPIPPYHFDTLNPMPYISNPDDPDMYYITFEYPYGYRPNPGFGPCSIVDNTEYIAYYPPNRPGYTFNGWSISPTGSPDFYLITQASDINLYAVWEGDQHTITFDANSSEGNTSGLMRAGAPLIPPAVTKTGYTLMGWDPSLPDTVPEQDTTYTAIWAANSYTVNFESNGGSAVAPITQEYGKTVSQPPIPVRNEYVFKGWYTDPELTNAVTWPYMVGASDVTFYAKWAPVHQTYALRFDCNGGSGGYMFGYDIPAQTYVTLSFDEYLYVDFKFPYPYTFPGCYPTVMPQPPMKTGYTFSGWSMTPDGEPITMFFMPASDVTLYAVWSKDPVSLNACSGSTAKIDKANHRIFGLEEGISQTELENDYVHKQGNVRLHYESAQENIGTGTKVELVDNGTGAVVDTYTVVIYGDVDGDGYVTAQDENQIKMAAAYQTTFGEGSAYENAADVNKDGVVDAFDLNIIRAALSGIKPLDQTNPGI